MNVILGLTGSLGSGKTFVSSLFSQCHAKVICADELAREAVAPGSKCLGTLVEEFGSEILKEDGTVDRPKLAQIVFTDRTKRKKLEEIIHPEVRKRASKLLHTFRDAPLIVLDIPLLFETGYDTDCDYVAVVRIDESERIRRLRDKRGMERTEIEARLSAQMPQEEKVTRADFVIDNTGSRAATARQVTEILHRLFPGELPEPLREPMPETD